MKKIAVICALPPERNTGMATVDLSAFSNLKRMVPGPEITLYTYGKPNQWAYQEGELPFHPIDMIDHQEQFFASDLFIYWGDFVHSCSYWKYDKGDWNKQELRDEEYRTYSKFMFLSELPIERLKNVIVFGSTIITNDAEDEINPSYNQNYQRFFTNIGAVFFRDALSAAKISALRPLEPTLSCDCALLLEKEDLAQLNGFAPAAHRENIGVFFGRSPSKIYMMIFARVVAHYADQSFKWIPWFHSLKRFRWLAKPFGYNISSSHATPGELLSELSGCSFVITDTYHMCVNAWQLGIPAICIGEGSGKPQHSLSDKKKEILYEMYGARQFYIFLETIHSVRTMFSEAKRIGTLIKRTDISDQVITNIDTHARTARLRLQQAVKSCIR